MQGDLLEGYQSNPGERNFPDQMVAREVDGRCSIMVQGNELDRGNKKKKEVKDDSMDFDLSSW